jgi:hypothetical protein
MKAIPSVLRTDLMRTELTQHRHQTQVDLSQDFLLESRVLVKVSSRGLIQLFGGMYRPLFAGVLHMRLSELLSIGSTDGMSQVVALGLGLEVGVGVGIVKSRHVGLG